MVIEDRISSPGSRRGRGPRGRLLLCLGCVLLAVGAPRAQGVGGDVDATRTALEKWVETRQVISAERRDWALGKEILEERLDLVGQEIESLTERITDAEESVAEADVKLAELVEENDRLEQATEALAEMVAGLEGRTARVLARLPDPIRERVKPFSQRFPEEGKETKLSLSERFQNVVGVLNEVNRFNREITVASEVRALSDGTSAEVTALYVGLGHGFYVSGDGKVAGVGRPEGDAWAWTEANEAAEQIALAIAIHRNEEAARFVRLPVQIDGGEG